VSRVKRNGFSGKTTPGKQFVGSNGQGQTCMVTNMSANGYVTVVIEEASEEDKEDGGDVELEHIGSNMERLQKQMQDISKEIMEHPERAEELREKILKISQEMQKETQRLQEKVRK
jgi:peptidoglycan hydrolase CwlO-like protein